MKGGCGLRLVLPSFTEIMLIESASLSASKAVSARLVSAVLSARCLPESSVHASSSPFSWKRTLKRTTSESTWTLWYSMGT